MQVLPEFPDNRRRDPKRQAELRVYKALQASDEDGIAIYGARLNRKCREIDFLALLTDVARFGIEVKGSPHRLDGTAWQRKTADGWEPAPNPLTQTLDSAMQMRDALGEYLEHRPFILPVLLFPDMEPDRGIEARATRAGVHILFGMDQLAERLVEIGQEASVFYPPTREEVDQEAEIIMPGVRASVGDVEGLELRSHLVVIHAQVVNIQTEPGSQLP